MNSINYKGIATFIFGLIVIWTGLLRCIEAEAFKPNAFWFCLVCGSIALVAAYLYFINRAAIATVIVLIALAPVLGFYAYCFIVQPEKDANYRIATAIIASIAELFIVILPAKKPE